MRAVCGLVLALALLACGAGGPSPSPSATPAASGGLFSPGVIPSAEQLCHLLSVADWTAAGFGNAREPSVQSDEPGSAYCTYGGGTAAAGALELDVFAATSVDAASLTYATLYESIPDPQAPAISGVDDAVINPNIEPGFGAIVVRTGRLVVTITLPASDNATNQLVSMTTLVLARAAALR